MGGILVKIYAVQILTGQRDLAVEQIQNLEHPKIGKVYNLKKRFWGFHVPGVSFCGHRALTAILTGRSLTCPG